MRSLVRPEVPTASVGSSQAPTAAVDNSAPPATRPQSTHKSGKVVQTSGAPSLATLKTTHPYGFVTYARLLAKAMLAGSPSFAAGRFAAIAQEALHLDGFAESRESIVIVKARAVLLADSI
jgi:hypothetical protein